MEPSAVAAVVIVISLLSLVIISALVACIRTVPDGSVDLVSRYGRDIGERRPGRYLAIPYLDASETVQVAPFNREVSHRSSTIDRFDVFVRLRFYFTVSATATFAPRRRVFDDKHEEIVVRMISAVLAERTHDEVIGDPEEAVRAISQGVAALVAPFGVSVTAVVTEQISPTLTGIPVIRAIGAKAPMVLDPMEMLMLAFREREARLARPAFFAPQRQRTQAPTAAPEEPKEADADDVWALFRTHRDMAQASTD